MNTFESDDHKESEEEAAHELLEQELKELLACIGKEANPSMSFPSITDMSEKLSKGEEVIRVELQPCKERLQKYGGRVPVKSDISNSLVDNKSVVVGMLPISNLPKEGEVFQMFYHSCDGVLRFGQVTSVVPIDSVHQVDGYYFFSAEGSKWRLSTINNGN